MTTINPKRWATPLRTAFAAALCVLAIAGCGGESEQDLIKSAEAYLQKGEPKAAAIQLKSALRKNERSGQARLLLGKALLASGDPVVAEVELRKALELNVDQSAAIPALARALLAQGETGKLTQQFDATELKDAAATADLKTTLATAHGINGDKESAQEAAKAAQTAVPSYGPALVVSARLKASDGHLDDALFLLDEVLLRDPQNQTALLFRGDLLAVGKNDKAAALAAYRSALAAHPASLAAHSSVISVLQQQGDVAGAKAQFVLMKKALPNHLQTRFYEANFAYLDKDFNTARQLTEQILKVSPDNPLALQLAGAAEYQMKALLQAENLLGRALKIAPSLPLARQLLAQTYTRTGQPGKAVELLQPLIEGPDADPGLLALAGEAYLQSGDAKRSALAFERASKANPKDPKVRTSIALGQLARGDEQGLVALQSIATTDTTGSRADLALISARLGRNDLAGALVAIDGLTKKQPDKPLGWHLQARVMMLRKDFAGATQSLEKALSLDPVYFPAVASLAALDLQGGKPELAKKRFDDLLRAEPKNVRAMLALAELKARTGGSVAEVTALITEAVKLDPSAPEPRLLLVNHHLAQQDGKLALAAAQDAAAALPTDLGALEALGRAQLAAGDTQQAVSSFKKLAALQPSRPQPQLHLAGAYQAQKDHANARLSYKRALEIKDDLLIAHRGLAMLWLLEGRPQEALSVAKTVQKQHPTDPTGYTLEGAAEANRKNWDAAVTAYRGALQRGKGGEPAILLHGTLIAAGKLTDAERFAATWAADSPQDALFAFYLGDLALAKGDFAAAETRYRAVARAQPQNALALNNIAWLMVKLSKPGAVPFAEQANSLMPGRPALLDTLASALLAENQAPRALQAQKKALERAPDDASLRLNLARIYLKTGDKLQAKSELDKLLKLGDKFPAQAEVNELLKSV